MNTFASFVLYIHFHAFNARALHFSLGYVAWHGIGIRLHLNSHMDSHIMLQIHANGHSLFRITSHHLASDRTASHRIALNHIELAVRLTNFNQMKYGTGMLTLVQTHTHTHIYSFTIPYTRFIASAANLPRLETRQ